MVLHFGQFLFIINWEQKSISFPSFESKSIPGKQIPDDCFVLHIDDHPLPEIECSTEGWKGVSLNGFHQVVYSQYGEPLFSLRYKPPEREAFVRIHQPERGAAELGIRFGMLAVLHAQCIGLHGATLLCGNEIVILSAPSGTGKTTLSDLLEAYCNAITINGDFAMLSISEEGVIFEPTPFCGTSGRCLNHRFRVNRVVFLEQSKTNQWRDLTGREAMTRFMSNVFVPVWDSDMRRTVQENVLKIVSALKVNAFAFAPTEEAAEVFLKKLKEDSALYSEGCQSSPSN